MSDEVVEEIQESDLIAMAEALAAAEEALAAEQARQEAAKEALLTSIGSDIDAKLSNRMGRRGKKEAQWLEAAKLYLGSLACSSSLPNENDPFYSKEDSQNDRKPEVNIVRVKCDTAISQTIAYQFASGDKNWDLNPPAVIDLDDEDMQQAQQAAGKPLRPEEASAYKAGLMSKEIEYHLTCSRYAQEARLSMKDRAILGTGIMKGPTNSGKLKKVYTKTTTLEGKTIRVPVFTVENVPQVYRVNPWYFYPDDSVTEITKAEDAIELHPMSKLELKELQQRPDFFADRIEMAIKDGPKSYTNSPFNDAAYLTTGSNLHKNKFHVVEFHGPLTKEMLGTLGICECDEGSLEEQYAEIWTVNGIVIKLELSNLEGSFGVPYCVAVWEPDPGSLFGFGIPMLTRDQQRVVNETWKMLLDNAGISAGPQVVVDTTLITPASGGLECEPWKVWYSTEYGADVTKAIQFFTPPNSFDGLASLFQLAKQLADEESSIPLLLSGLNTPTGVGDSATGMALMNQNASSPLFYKSEEWDDGITQPIISMMYDWEMQFNPKEDIKGTYDIDVRTSTSYLRNTQDMQKLQALSMEIAQGSPAGEWINHDELTQVRLMGMRLPYKNILKSPEQVEQERANAPEPPPDPAMIKAQAEMRRVDNEEQRLKLDAMIAQAESEQAQRLAEIQAQVQFGTNETRRAEAEAQVIKAQYDFQSSMAAVASKDEQARAKLLASINSAEMDKQVKLFLAGMQHQTATAQLKQKEQQLAMQERSANARHK